MSKYNEVPNAKLSFDKETVANLSEQEMDQLAGGQEAAYQTVNSTASDITCCWCTSTRPTPVEEQV
ncbi:class I lanthipeptide [Hymenobacter terrestris]|uniref:RSAM-modified peptide n=1 Tax=Hymenobacter terrestris TaxID=2748310 RepID=A0ABX2Q7D5_9BACT|nr:class I lanthipeptide [Hymenobacter terrestris]NVO85875.1 rSAM-modified peptide [Hymenobacter terrestris]NVO85876.1 rSAM-modified peptide [Hymenobacter terrestris]